MALEQSLKALTETGYRPAAAPALHASRAAAGAALWALVRQEVPALRETANPAIAPAFEAHLDAQLAEIHRLVGGSGWPQLEFVRRHAAAAAEHRFPLEATLHAYRCCHRGITRWLREAAGAEALPVVDDFVIDWIDAVSTLAAAEYVKRTRQLSEAEADRRSYLLATLLEGYDESDGRVASLLRGAGYLEQRQAYCVVLVRPLNLKEMDNPARAERLLAATRDALAKLDARGLYGLHEQHVVAVVCATRRQSGWTAPQAGLAERVAWPLLTLGNAVLAGVSADAPATALIPKALREAQLALALASAGERVVQYAGIPLRRLLVHLAAGNVQSALPAWTGDFLAADRRARGKLSATLRAYGDADMNVLKAAKALGVHPNTVYGRMQKIRELTGLDPIRFNALDELLLALDCLGG